MKEATEDERNKGKEGPVHREFAHQRQLGNQVRQMCRLPVGVDGQLLVRADKCRLCLLC